MRFVYFLYFLIGIGANANAQFIFSQSPNKTILPAGGTIYDTITVFGVPGTSINGVLGLDSISLNATYPYEYDLVISLIAPDGTVVHLNEQFGSGPDFINTCFTGHSTSFVNDAGSPFSGQYLPANWLGNVNNGQNANGNWVLQITNNGWGADTGVLINWGLAFDSTPSPPSVFSQSNLPIVELSLGNQPIIKYAGTDVIGSMGIINNTSGINHIADPFNDFSGHIKIKARGSSSQWFPSLAYSVGIIDVSGNDTDASLLGMPADHSWVLYEPWDDKAMMRNVLTYRLSNEMGEYAVRTRYVELVLDGDYRGVYVLMERISRGANRVNVQKLTTADVALPAITGGYILSIDKNANSSNSWSSSLPPCTSGASPLTFQYINPKPADINTEQKDYIAAYVDSFEQQLNAGDLYDTVSGYRHFIDVPSFIDQSLLQEIGRNVDGYRLSTYMHKRRNGKLEGGPIWDFNLAYGNADYYDGSNTNTWQWDFPCMTSDPFSVPFWWQKMLMDTNYVHELRCRYTLLRNDVLDTTRLDNIIDSFALVLDSAQARHYTRWPIMGVYTWPNYYVGSSYGDEVAYLKGWLHMRIRFMDSMLYDTTCHPPVTLGTANTGKIDKGISVYPDPATTELYIDAGSAAFASATITNSMGQVVRQQPMNAGRNSLEIQALIPGVYFISLEGAQGKYVTRFVKW